MILSHFFSKMEDGFIYFFMPVVTCYHLVCSNVFLNTAAQDAQGLEKVGDYALAPFRYLFGGSLAIPLDGEKGYDIRQYFDYHEHLILKTAGAVISLPFSVVVGSAVKGIAFLSKDVRLRHRCILDSYHATYVISNNENYRSLAIDLGKTSLPKLTSKGYQRRAEDENHLCEEKKAFFEIVKILKENHILFWADCGTCLGAYRYGGMIPWDNDLDLSILEPDFVNVRRVLNALDFSKYLVEDWSNRLFPNTYIRVYIRATRGYIDIYCFAIYPERQTIQYICSHMNNMFMIKGWKLNEKYYTVETSYEVVFPLRIADFDGVEIYVPNQTEKYLQMRYGANLSPVKIYNAETNTYEKDLSHPYWQRAFAH